MLKLLVVFGTRPEAIKMAPLIHQLKNDGHFIKVCVTAQHREMLDQVLDFFEITPDYDFNLMQPNQTLNGLSAKVINNMDALLNKETFDWVLVHGDTTTSSMVALASFHQGVKVAHVEAGLRTYDKTAPFPEEINRQITARIADLHFVPTLKAKANLLNESIDESTIVLTGNTVIDALKWALNKMKLKDYYNEQIEDLKHKLNLKKQLVLVTGHRRENFGSGFQRLCKALQEIAKRNDVEMVYPVHLNPNVQKPVFEVLEKCKNIHLIDPVAYPVMIWLMKQSKLIISDSGGIQEEAPSLKVPVLVTRDTSERLEGIEKGFSVLVGTNTMQIVEKANYFLDKTISFKDIENPYGDGNASSVISKHLMLSKKTEK